MSSQCPNENWSVERLGKFCSHSEKKLAVDAWRFGRALSLARAKQEHGKWKEWKQQYVPHLTHSSEHRYRTLADRLGESSLEGMGLTEAYRLLDLTYTKSRKKDGDDLFPGAPEAVPAEDGDPGEDAPDDSDDIAVLPLPARFHDLPPATGVMDIEAEDDAPPTPAHTVAVEAGTGDRNPPPGLAPQEDLSPEDDYRLRLVHARRHLEALRSWADWLKDQGKGFRAEMWKKHGVGAVVGEIDLTVEGLRWLKKNLPR